MITVKDISPLLTNGASLPFLDAHILTEAFIRRIVYLGCRKNGFANEDAQHIATYQFIRGKRLYTTLFEMLSGDPQLASKLRESNPDFDRLIKLYEDYSSIYRNRVVHGAATLSTGGFENLLRHIDVSFASEFDRVLKSHFGKSALDSPVKWGFSSPPRRSNFAHARADMLALAQSKNWHKTFGGEKILHPQSTKSQAESELRKTSYGIP